MFNSDDEKYGGNGVKNASPCKVSWEPSHGQESSVAVTIPAFGAVFFRGTGKLRAKPKKKETVEPGETPVKKTRAKKAAAAEAAAETVTEAPKKRGRKPKAAAAEAAAEEKPKRTRKKAEDAEEKKPARRGRKKASDDAE